MEEDLFGAPVSPDPPPPSETCKRDSIADWQVAQLRASLDATGLTDMGKRQALIERLVGRPVATLRDLTWTEGRALAERLASERSKISKKPKASSWDDREEDSWIDRL